METTKPGRSSRIASDAQVDAMLAAPADWKRVPSNVRMGTLEALERRDLVATRLTSTYFEWRVTPWGVKVADSLRRPST